MSQSVVVRHMNRDEQKQILALIDRAVNGDPNVPARQLDIEADAIIRALFVRNPEAAYHVTMLAIAQAQQIEALRSALTPPGRTVVQSLLAKLFNKRPLSESSHERGIRILERPVNG